MSNSVRLGIAGLGTVGTGVLDILRDHAALVDMRAGRGVAVTGVSARSRGKNRGHDLSKFEWQDDPVALAKSAGIDVFIELIGGDTGPARDAVEAALKSGKHVIWRRAWAYR
jgi:homoserine dehydrogenase